MHSFPLYLQLGFEHISNLAGFDHILFLIALCAVYRIEQWRSIVILVTAFTIGHSVTLALTSVGTLTIPSSYIEFLIPTTILFTAIHNLFGDGRAGRSLKPGWNYLMALIFGFIHGMGFSNYFRALLMDESSILIPLLGFNLGIELGQLLVVSVVVAVAFVFLNLIRVSHRDWNVFVSGAAAGISMILMYETRPWQA